MDTSTSHEPSHEPLSADETTTLLRAFVMAGMSVAAAKSSGAAGTVTEYVAIAEGFIAQIERHPHNSIFSALANDAARAEIERLLQQFNPETIKLHEIKPFALRRCDELADILDAKSSPAERAEVKQALLAVCQSVAEASKEGGFFGIGGTRVGLEEAAVIREVARALRVDV